MGQNRGFIVEDTSPSVLEMKKALFSNKKYRRVLILLKYGGLFTCKWQFRVKFCLCTNSCPLHRYSGHWELTAWYVSAHCSVSLGVERDKRRCLPLIYSSFNSPGMVSSHQHKEAALGIFIFYYESRDKSPLQFLLGTAGKDRKFQAGF